MISEDTVAWHQGAAQRDAAYLALGSIDDTETTDGPWSGGVADTYDYADHPYTMAGDRCTCGRPFEEHAEAIR